MEQRYPKFPEKVKEMIRMEMNPDDIALQLDVPPAQVRRVIGRRLKYMGLHGKNTIKNAAAEVETMVRRLELDASPQQPPNEELDAARRNLAELNGLARSLNKKPGRETGPGRSEEGWLFRP